MEEKKSKGDTPEIPFDLVQDDPMSRLFTRAWDFCYLHAREVIFTGLALVLAVSGGVSYINWKAAGEREAFARLGLAQQASEAGTQDALSVFLGEVRDLAASQPGTLGGRMARLYEARLLLKEGDLSSALAAYDTALATLGSDNSWGDIIVWERAYVHMALGNREAALTDFRKASSHKGFLEESALFHIARLEFELGRQDAARVALDRLLEQYPDSPYKDTGLL